MKRGDVFWINLESGTPPEFGKTRPGLIISNSEQNTILPTVVILPLSSKGYEIWPLRLEIPLAYKKKSYAVVPGIRQVNKSRLLEKIGTAPDSVLKKLGEAIALYLDV